MKQLRQTIRKILLENQQHYESLADLFNSGRYDLIHQAIELAETLEYIANVTYEVSHHTWAGQNEEQHRWDFDADQGLSDAIKHMKKTNPMPNPDFGARFDYPSPGKTVIRQIVRIPKS